MASIEPLKLLLSLGFDPNVVNEAKETPLFVAARTNNMDAASVLLDSSVDYRIKNIDSKLIFYDSNSLPSLSFKLIL